MIQKLNPASTLDQFLLILRARKWHLLACIVGVLAPIVIYNLTVPPVYETSASIIFEDKGNPFLQHKNDLLSRYYRHRETYILNRIEEITSRSLAEEVAAILPPSMVARFDLHGELSQSSARKSLLVKKIQEAISAAPSGNTDVILITARTPEPQLSQHLANTTATTLRDRNLRIKRSEVAGMREFVKGQLQIFREQLDTSEEKLKELKQKGNITSLEQESREILARITSVEVVYNQVKAERMASEERVATIRKKLNEQQAELVPRIADVASSSLQSLQDRLVKLQTQHTTLLVQDYAPGHPKMVALNAEIAQLKKNLREAASQLAVDNLGVDPLSQIHSYLRESLSLEIELESLKAKEQDLLETMKRYEAALRTLPAKELELVNLLRNKSINEKIYLRLMEKYEEAKITEAEKNANVRIIDTAQLPDKPIAPRKAINLLIGFIFAFIAGSGLVLFLEYQSPVFRRPEEVETLTNWRVLACVPRASSFNGKATTNWTTNRHSSNGLQSGVRPFSRRPEIKPDDAYRTLRTNISLLREKAKLNTIQVASVCAHEGKSTTTVNIARMFAKLGTRVLVVDADIRRPVLHKLMGVADEPGLSDILARRLEMVRYFSSQKNEQEFDLNLSNSVMELTVQQLVGGIQSTDIANLKVLPRGKPHEEPGDIISPGLMGWLLEEQRTVESRAYYAAVISTPTKTHYALAKQALEKGLHTFVEKPLATCARHGQELIDLAQKQGVILFVGHLYLYNAAVKN